MRTLSVVIETVGGCASRDHKMADDDTQRYHCSYCGCDITLRLKCAVCSELDLCLQCFAAGAVAGPHKRDHSYQLIDEGSFPLLVDDWGAIEEVLLLDAVEHDGFGNWEDIAAHVVTKTARESRDHYSDTYINGVIGEGTIPPRHHASILDGRGGEAPPRPPSYTPVKLDQVEQQELGYMALRDDFEREYDNSLEKVISEVTVGADEDEVERSLKLALVDIYNKGLTEREKRKSIAKQHSLIAGKQRLSALKRKLSKEEKRLRDKFKTVSRLLEAEEYDQLLASIKKERQLKQRIAELSRYRKNGITKMEDCSEFDVLKQEQAKLRETKEGEELLPQAAGDDDEDGDLSSVASLALLSGTERKLCYSVGVQAEEYLSCKSDILRNSALKRNGYPGKQKLPRHLGSEQRSRLMGFFSKCGWTA